MTVTSPSVSLRSVPNIAVIGIDIPSWAIGLDADVEDDSDGVPGSSTALTQPSWRLSTVDPVPAGALVSVVLPQPATPRASAAAAAVTAARRATGEGVFTGSPGGVGAARTRPPGVLGSVPGPVVTGRSRSRPGNRLRRPREVGRDPRRGAARAR